jgi:sugar phosphate isomerase/epimerase
MRLGVDTYSLRWQGWDAFQLLDYAASLGLDTVQYSDRANFASLDEGYLRTVMHRADELGMHVEVGMGSFDRFAQSFKPSLGTGEEQLSTMLRVAAVVGSPVVRCFLGARSERFGSVSVAQHIDECVRTLRAVAPLCSDLGIKVAVENHGGVDLLARELRMLVETAGPATVGVCLDTGNPAYACEDPLLTAEVLAPYVVTSHVRDTRVWMTEEGAMAQWAPLGEGNVDLAGILRTLQQQAPHAPIDLEIITGGSPQAMPFSSPLDEVWRAYPDMPARDFARFITLARKGTPGPLAQHTLPPGVGMPPHEQADAFRAQQRRHFEQSVTYFKAHLATA